MVFFEFFITIQSVLRLTKTASTTSCRITELVKPIFMGYGNNFCG